MGRYDEGTIRPKTREIHLHGRLRMSLAARVAGTSYSFFSYFFLFIGALLVPLRDPSTLFRYAAWVVQDESVHDDCDDHDVVDRPFHHAADAVC